MGGRAGDALLARAARARRGADAHVRGSGRARERSAKTATAETPSPSAARAPARSGAASRLRRRPRARFPRARFPRARFPLPRSWTIAREAGPAWTRTRARRRRRRSCRWRPSRRWRTKGTSRSPCPRPRRRMRGGARRRDRRAPTRNARPLGAVSRFAHPPTARPPPLLADEPATREAAGFETQKEEKGVAGVPRRARPADAVSSSATSSSTPRAPLTARTYVSGGGEDLVEAFSRSRHGRARSWTRCFPGAWIRARARRNLGLTLLHIAAQNNQRKTAKLVLKRTDYAVDPPSREILNQQTNAGQTALHYAFAYGYHDLARWLVSLGADDGGVNAHGLSCYEGLDPDEPAAREALAAPEMLEMARRKRQERRAEAGGGRARASAPRATARGGTTSSTRRDGSRGGRGVTARTEGPPTAVTTRTRYPPRGASNRPPAGTLGRRPSRTEACPPRRCRRRRSRSWRLPWCRTRSRSGTRGVLVRVRVPDTRAPRGSPRRDPASFRPRRSRTRTRRARTGAWSRAPTACTANFTGILCIRCILPTRTRRRRGDPVAAARFAAAAAHRNRATAPPHGNAPYGNAPYGNAGFFPAPGFRGDLFPEAGARVPARFRPEGPRGRRAAATEPHHARRAAGPAGRRLVQPGHELGRGFGRGVRARDRRT